LTACISSVSWAAFSSAPFVSSARGLPRQSKASVSRFICRAEIAGFDVAGQPNEVRQSIGMVFQDPSLDDRLTAEENLRFHAMLYHVPPDVLGERMDQVGSRSSNC